MAKRDLSVPSSGRRPHTGWSAVFPAPPTWRRITVVTSRLTEITHHVPTGKAVEVIALVRDGALEVIDLVDAGGRIHDLMKKYADRPMDLADASLVWAAEHTGIEESM